MSVPNIKNLGLHKIQQNIENGTIFEESWKAIYHWHVMITIENGTIFAESWKAIYHWHVMITIENGTIFAESWKAIYHWHVMITIENGTIFAESSKAIYHWHVMITIENGTIFAESSKAIYHWHDMITREIKFCIACSFNASLAIMLFIIMKTTKKLNVWIVYYGIWINRTMICFNNCGGVYCKLIELTFMWMKYNIVVNIFDLWTRVTYVI